MTDRVLFGLGNPGIRYRKTRHNAGFQTLDLLAERHDASFKRTRLLMGEVSDFRLGDARVRMVEPHSFMNRCGPVYRRALEVFDVDADRALVVVDDFALPLGRLRIRAEGSAGGHNGLRSIEDAMGGGAYPRLRIGIGPVPEGVDPAVWVLKRYDATQRRVLPDLLDRAAEAALTWVAEGLESAANRFNPA